MCRFYSIYNAIKKNKQGLGNVCHWYIQRMEIRNNTERGKTNMNMWNMVLIYFLMDKIIFWNLSEMLRSFMSSLNILKRRTFGIKFLYHSWMENWLQSIFGKCGLFSCTYWKLNLFNSLELEFKRNVMRDKLFTSSK